MKRTGTTTLLLLLGLAASPAVMAAAEVPFSGLSEPDWSRLSQGETKLDFNLLRPVARSGDAGPVLRQGLVSKEVAPASPARLWVRLRSLDALNAELPSVLRKAGLEHLSPPDLVVASGSKAGYDFTVRLKESQWDAPLGPCGNGCANEVIASFQDGDQVQGELKLPGARIRTKLDVELVSQHFYLPNIHESFELTASGVEAISRTRASIDAGKLATSPLEFPVARIREAHVENAGVLGRIVDTVLGLGDLCGPDCHSLDDFVLKTANSELEQALRSGGISELLRGQISKALSDPLHFELPLSDLGVSAGVTPIRLSVAASGAVFGFAVEQSLLRPEDPCGTGLETPAEAPVPGALPEWRGETDVEVAVSQDVLRELLQGAGREGALCGKGSGKTFHTSYEAAIRPVGKLSVEADPRGSALDVTLPFALDLRTLPHSLLRLRSKGVGGSVRARLDVSAENGLVLRLGDLELGRLGGSVRIDGIPIAAEHFRRPLFEALQSNLRSRMGELRLLQPSQSLGVDLKLEPQGAVAIDSTWVKLGFRLSR